MIFISAKLDILSIRVRDALIEIQNMSQKGLSPAQIILWQLEQSDLEIEINRHTISPTNLKAHYPLIEKFQRIRYFFKNYLLLHRYLGACKKALSDFKDSEKSAWINKYQMLAENELDLYCGDIFERQIFIRNRYNLRIDNTYFTPIIDFLELFESIVIEVKKSL